MGEKKQQQQKQTNKNETICCLVREESQNNYCMYLFRLRQSGSDNIRKSKSSDNKQIVALSL